jgi:hypothetical protein
MKSALRLGLIVNTWNQSEYLARVLRAISAQVSRPDEVLLADDGSDDATRDVFGKWCAAQSFSAVHLWQEHKGFAGHGYLTRRSLVPKASTSCSWMATPCLIRASSRTIVCSRVQTFLCRDIEL